MRGSADTEWDGVVDIAMRGRPVAKPGARQVRSRARTNSVIALDGIYPDSGATGGVIGCSLADLASSRSFFIFFLAVHATQDGGHLKDRRRHYWKYHPSHS
jgi:hypothetical protein